MKESPRHESDNAVVWDSHCRLGRRSSTENEIAACVCWSAWVFAWAAAGTACLDRREKTRETKRQGDTKLTEDHGDNIFRTDV
jgi:hypothetical protein